MDKKELYELCEDYGEEWIYNNPQAYGDVKRSRALRRQRKKECKRFIKERVAKDLKERKSGSVIVSILMPFILELIVNAIMKRLMSTN